MVRLQFGVWIFQLTGLFRRAGEGMDTASGRWRHCIASKVFIGESAMPWSWRRGTKGSTLEHRVSESRVLRCRIPYSYRQERTSGLCITAEFLGSHAMLELWISVDYVNLLKHWANPVSSSPAQDTINDVHSFPDRSRSSCTIML
jgi:hypothetical protein